MTSALRAQKKEKSMKIVRCENQNPFFARQAPYWGALLGEALLRSPEYNHDDRTQSVNWSEEANQYLIQFELPGLKREEIKLSFEGGLLTLKGNKKIRRAGEDQVIAVERRVAIPEGVNPEKIEAKYEDGVLEVTLPKREEIKPKEIAIQVK